MSEKLILSAYGEICFQKLFEYVDSCIYFCYFWPQALVLCKFWITRNNNFPTYNCRTDCFEYYFFPSPLNDWFRLDINIRNSESISLFKSRLLPFIRPNQSKLFIIFDSIGLKLLTRLRLGLSHLNEHKFRHKFQDCLNPFCFCSLEV